MQSELYKVLKDSIDYWYLPLVSGILFFMLGIWTFRSPVESYLALSTLFSISFIISGFLETMFTYINREKIESWGWSLALSLLTILIGILLLANPKVSMMGFSLFVGFVLLFRSFGTIGWSLNLKEYGTPYWGALMVIGILGIICSTIMIWNPQFAGMTIIIWTGLALLFCGIFSIYLAIRLKKLHKIKETLPDE